MNTEIQALEPMAVWKNFANLNAVPRPSKKEERVIAFMVDFGKNLGLETMQDQVGNVVIRKPATTGMENRKMITLQSHLDMVHQKNATTQFDFELEGIQMYIEGDWVKANGTTLGADNGMGVAAIMSLLESNTIPHPELEALFTIDEETGMTGAMGLEPNVLQGEILLNLDTEEDDELDIGCAGGIDVTASRSYKLEAISDDVIAYEIGVKGLQGGHSGIDIHKGLGNANKIMNRLLYHNAKKQGIRVSEIDGGGLRNAIPRESKAILIVSATEVSNFETTFSTLSATIKQELTGVEPGVDITLKKTTVPEQVMEISTQEKLLNALYSAYNGVYAMSSAIPDLVETSNNIARVEVADGKITIACLTRSSVNSAKMDLAYALKATFELADCVVTFSGDYPGWNPSQHSPILEVLREQYRRLFHEEPKVAACHAGLECGILGQHYPNMDMISFGPTIEGAHSPDEKVKISSVQKFWNFLLEILKHIPEKV